MAKRAKESASPIGQLPVLSEQECAELAQREENAALIRALKPTLDIGIARAVEILLRAGVETYESCEGGPGHPYPEPTIRFHGRHEDGFRALGIALYHCLPVYALRRVWTIQSGEPTGPTWELVFSKPVR